jgi:hypothetical protein
MPVGARNQLWVFVVADELTIPAVEEGQPDTIIAPRLRVAWFDATLAFPVPTPGNGSWTLVSSDFTTAANANPVLDPIEGEPRYTTPKITAVQFVFPFKNEDKNKIQMQ